MNKNQILTHRGLEPSKENFYSESSFEAFEDQLNRGFGIEFDPNFTKDGIIVVHDASLSRITNGKDKRLFSDLTTEEATQIKLEKGRICTLIELLELLRKSNSKINAMHLKGKFQDPHYLEILITELQKFDNTPYSSSPSTYAQDKLESRSYINSNLLNRILIFDVKPETAKYIKTKIPNLHLAPSVVHKYDIERYNSAVLGTLISLEDALKYKQEGLYDWVWLDEWDRTDKDGKDKTFYNEQTFRTLKNAGYKIALVTPELHGTSPGLLGGEAHQDAANKEKLFTRIKEIINLNPDAICTDYPEETSSFSR